MAEANFVCYFSGISWSFHSFSGDVEKVMIHMFSNTIVNFFFSFLNRHAFYIFAIKWWGGSGFSIHLLTVNLLLKNLVVFTRKHQKCTPNDRAWNFALTRERNYYNILLKTQGSFFVKLGGIGWQLRAFMKI